MVFRQNKWFFDQNLGNNKVLSNIIYSQSIHSKYGGVVPDLASKDHEKNILEVVETKKIAPAAG